MKKIKYFINYKDLKNNNTINKEITPESKELKIIKKYKDGNIKIIPLSYFKENAKLFLENIDELENNKKGICLMVELTKEETLLISPSLIKKYRAKNENVYEMIKSEIKLINYSAFANMTLKEMNSGNIHKLVTVISNGKNLFKITFNDKIINKSASITQKRVNLAERGIGSDIYFYTDDEEVLDKYKDNITILKETEEGLYKIENQQLLIIDSIPQNYVNDMSNETFRCLYELYNNSIPVYMKENDDKIVVDISIEESKDHQRKGYIFFGTNMNTLIYNKAIEPLLKYINIYHLKDDIYKITNIEEYMKKNNILKYIKKPSKN